MTTAYHIVFLLSVALTATARAAESSAGAPLPGLRSDENRNLVAESCLVTLSGYKTAVELSIRTTDSEPALLLEGAPFHWVGETEAYPDRHFPELEIRIDGAKVAPQERFEAFMGKFDITYAIRAAGMDPWAIARAPPITPINPDSRQVNMLEKMHAVERSGDRYLAHWTARRVLRIPLKTAAHQRVALSYLARPAFSQLQPDQMLTDAQLSPYCASREQVSALLSAGSKSRPVKITEYTIATGIDDHSPPTVRLNKSTGGGGVPSRVLTFSCGPQGKSIAVAGNLTHRPVQVDQAGNLRILEVTEP
jgi:hypothetical protein